MSIQVRFVYHTGITKTLFSNARLSGNWDRNGQTSDEWTSTPMVSTVDRDGSVSFSATIEFDANEVNKQFRWGVILDGPTGPNQWGIATEINATASSDCYRTFVLQSISGNNTQEEHYYLTQHRWLGANKQIIDGQKDFGLCFAVWAPNAEKVEVVFGTQCGYIANDGFGMLEDEEYKPIELFMQKNGVWVSEILPDYSKYDHKPYMYRITKEGGKVAFRTDLYSRCQIGCGNFDPNGEHCTGKATELDGTKSCSVIIDAEMVAKNFKEDSWPEHDFVSEKEFWKDEFTPGKPLPKRVEDLVIYELHIGALGYGKNRPGDFEDAIELLNYLVALGVNAIELLPINEFAGWEQWGYGTSHYFALEFSAGGRDKFKHFIKECHRRGIAVIMDVVYNHYHHNSERAEWGYDSEIPEHNIYYWYEGKANDYSHFNQVVPENQKGHGGYIDNMSTGYAPRYYEEMVRKMFISSAVALIDNFHIDGFRLDQTTSIHAYNVLHADGSSAGSANIFGAKFLREFSRTLKMIKPEIIITAEDHSDWFMVTEPPSRGGLGFDAVWYSNFYHHLSGDTGRGADFANLIRMAGFGNNQPLAMDFFGGVLLATANKKIIYHESHDEAGNSEHSMRTIVAAVNRAPLVGETRRVAESRCRFAIGMSILSAGTPMFLMGEEVGAEKDYKYTGTMANREDLYGLRKGVGSHLFKFYSELIPLRLKHPAIRSHNIDVLHVHNNNRVIVFKRWGANREFIIAASLNNYPFASGYLIENHRIDDGRWKEVFNSDAEIYGGNNVGNYGVSIPSSFGLVTVIIPANGFIVLQREQ
jgi:1,4-alpha-glucan branching enzyme